MSARYPETLSAEWTPPVPVGRRAELQYLTGCLRASEPTEVPRLGVLGPHGSGTSLLARVVARDWLSAQRPHAAAPGRLVAVRVRSCPGTVGVASALLRSYDEGFGGHGFSIAEVMAGLLRRMLREGGPVAVLLDDAGAAGPALGPILSALLRPGAFLPEGLTRTVPWAVLVAGSVPAPALAAELVAAGFSPEQRLTLPPYSLAELRAILLERSNRALGHPPVPEWLEELMARLAAEPGGATRGLELLREQLLGPTGQEPPLRPREARSVASIEPRLLAALARAAQGGPCEVGQIRRWEEEYARREGARPLALTTLWRRLVRLEQMGLLSREVRAGGPGGTRSVIRVHRGVPLESGLNRMSTRRASADGCSSSWPRGTLADPLRARGARPLGPTPASEVAAAAAPPLRAPSS